MKNLQYLTLVGALAATTVAQGSTKAIWQLSNDTEFSFSLEVTLALANGGGAATSEVLRAASQIAPGVYESYYDEFKLLADGISAQGHSSKSPSGSRSAFFRAASYYRAADFYLHGNQSDPRINTLWDSMLANYNAALALLQVPGERVSVKADGFEVPLIIYRPLGPANLRRPTMLACSGYDGAQEDLFHAMGQEVLERGWNFVTYEGPGQPTVRRHQGLGFRPDWWNVVTPAVSYLRTLGDVDVDRIALLGQSFGGTLAPRAASHEHRLAAVLAVDGIVDLQRGFLADFPSNLVSLFKSGDQKKFDDVVDGLTSDPNTTTSFRWLFQQGTWSFNTKSPFVFLTQLGEYVAGKEVLGNITCPVWVGQGQNENPASSQGKEMAELLGEKAHFVYFPNELGAGEHCQIGAEQQLSLSTLDWLDGVFAAVGDGKHR